MYFIGNQPKKIKWAWSTLGPMLWKNRETGKSMGFFDILHEVYIYKQEVVAIEIPEWKLKAKLASNTIFEGN